MSHQRDKGAGSIPGCGLGMSQGAAPGPGLRYKVGVQGCDHTRWLDSRQLDVVLALAHTVLFSPNTPPAWTGIVQGVPGGSSASQSPTILFPWYQNQMPFATWPRCRCFLTLPRDRCLPLHINPQGIYFPFPMLCEALYILSNAL